MVNRCADSYMNASMRFALSLTEKEPTIRSRETERWADFQDYLENYLSDSLVIKQGIHFKWGIHYNH